MPRLLTTTDGRTWIGLGLLACAVLTGLLLLRPTTEAAPPNYLNYQGTLTNNLGQPLLQQEYDALPEGPVTIDISKMRVGCIG